MWGVEGGVKEPSVTYSVKLPVQQAQVSMWQPNNEYREQNERYLDLIKDNCAKNACHCESPSPSRDLNYPLSYAAMIARTNLK